MSGRRWRWVVGTLAMAALLTATGAAHGQAQEASASKGAPFVLEGDTALLSVAIRADQTAAFEQVMTYLRDALARSADPRRRQQAEGWQVVRLDTPLSDGAVVYVHVIDVVPGANYSIMQILYDEYPDARQEMYELYRGAFSRSLSLATGRIALDLRSGTASAQGASPDHD